ncbi:unnamed protein product [Paramecium primaurelia]|uniref:Amino acid transporter transmembrane domain-containing protein n=1 Tax=Paramecium primaurelia TaxID=5886 RepID=A0A8S1LJI0_PARPR|nr:unnamed protein product [Paramecium primaurelia]
MEESFTSNPENPENSHNTKELSNSSQAFFNFIKSLVGIAILDLPYSANECGYGLASILLLILSYGTIRTSLMLIKVAEESDIHYYSKIVKEYMGPISASILDIFLSGQQLFACIAYIIFFQQMCQLALSNLPNYVSIIISLLVIIPLSLIRDLHFFHNTSTAGFFIAVFVLVAISGISISQFGNAQDVVAFNASGMFKFIGVAMFAYEGICTTLPVRYSMKDQKKFPFVFLSSSLTCLFMYIAFIIINCIALGSKLQQIIVFNLPNDKIWAFALQFLYAISILFTYPVQIYPAFTIIENRLKIRDTKIIWIVERLIVTTILYVIAYVIPSFNTFLNLIGMVFGTFLQFIYPITLYLLYFRSNLSIFQWIEASIVMLMGVGAGVLGLYFSIDDLVKQNK